MTVGQGNRSSWNRRDWIKGVGAGGAGLALGGWGPLALAQKPITIGMIYVGPKDDFGYNQSHYEAAMALKGMPGVKIVGVEPQTCNTLHAAMAAGERVAVKPSGLATDSLGASTVGKLMFEIARDHIAQVTLISDDDIRNAQRHLWREMQLVTEPGGAAAFAALLSGAYKPQKGERVGVVVCGANTSMDVFGQLFT